MRVIGLVLALGLALVPLATRAQPPDRVYRLGFLGQTSPSDLVRQTAALRQGLRDRGYEEGRNLVIEYRWAERQLDRLSALATELVGAKVDVIVTHGSPGSRAAKQATAEIPIVIAAVGDPVASGVVASLSRPGGNVTGLVLEEFESTVKWFELVKQVVPTAALLGWLDVPGIERPEVAEVWRQKEDHAARSLGFTIRRVTVREPNNLAQAFTTLEQSGVHAVIVPNTSLLNPLGAQIASLAVKHRLPAIGSPIFGRAGGLLAYGSDGADMYRRAAGYVDRILKGAAPAELAMEGPTKFELLINLKTAKVLGLTIPPTLLARADQVIE
jgi:putative tryptophan/tyrosine transport system substrate-binding protein